MFYTVNDVSYRNYERITRGNVMLSTVCRHNALKHKPALCGQKTKITTFSRALIATSSCSLLLFDDRQRFAASFALYHLRNANIISSLSPVRYRNSKHTPYSIKEDNPINVSPNNSTPLPKALLRSFMSKIAIFSRFPPVRLISSIFDTLVEGLARLEERFGLVVVYGKIVLLFLILLATVRSSAFFSALTIAVVLLQNASSDALNQLVVYFFESGLFTSFTEAAACAKLVTWLSIICMLLSHLSPALKP